MLTKSPNTDLSQGLTIPQVAAKHGWTEPMHHQPILSSDKRSSSERSACTKSGGPGNGGAVGKGAGPIWGAGCAGQTHGPGQGQPGISPAFFITS
jgi:hypothetical protein